MKGYDEPLTTYLTSTNSGTVSVKDFGAKGDGVTDDNRAFQAAFDYCVKNPATATTIRIPAGHNFITSKPLLVKNNENFFTIKIKGDVSNKSASNPYLSRITFTGRSGYALGVQLGRSIEIENITIMGQYTLPGTIGNANIGTTKFADWVQNGITDERNNPYSGISIDPVQNASGSAGGTSDVTIRNCAIKQFMVGIALTPNAGTLNDEIINITDNNIESCRVAIAIGQDQSKTVKISGLKVWSSTHTIVDGVNYGRGTGGGSVFCENWNIAGNVNQLFNLNTDRFPLSCKDIYSESIFRIGYVGYGVGANFINTQIDFLSGPGMPEADYLIQGQANFYGGMLRFYDGSSNHRLNLVGCKSAFRDMTLNCTPITTSLYGYPAQYPTPFFDNVHRYYGPGDGGSVVTDGEAVTRVYPTAITVDRTTWTATVTGSGAFPGDYILGSPSNSNRHFYDNPALICNTKQIGRVVKVEGDTAYLDCVGLNVFNGDGYDAVYISRVKP
jgi:hypothetical protein